MLHRMKRRAVLRLAAIAPMAALALRSDGARAARPYNCSLPTLYCGGEEPVCSGGCQLFCAPPNARTHCPACAICIEVDEPA